MEHVALQRTKKRRAVVKFNLKKRHIIRTLNWLGLIKSGDVLGIFLFLPIFRKLTKKILKKYQLQWNLQGGGREFIFKKNYTKQLFLRLFAERIFKKYWKFSSFVCLTRFSTLNNDLRLVSGFFKIKKVIISLFCYLSAHNVISSFCLKKGTRYRRKSLNYMLLNYERKMRRLYPIRRMNKKKKKNR